MRQILIDHARARETGKRGGGGQKFSLDEAIDAAAERPARMLAIDDALQALERIDPSKARLIEMRFFGGLTAEESAQVLELPVEKVRAQLRVAQAWLQRELDRDAKGEAAQK
jgi:RNA polymerase sigma factor (TIGR02999 family)